MIPRGAGSEDSAWIQLTEDELEDANWEDQDFIEKLDRMTRNPKFSDRIRLGEIYESYDSPIIDPIIVDWTPRGQPAP